MVDILKTIDYIWLQKWNDMTLADLEKEKLLLIDKINSYPPEAVSYIESSSNVLEDLEQYMIDRSLKEKSK